MPKDQQDEAYGKLEQYFTAVCAAEVLRQRNEKLTYAFAKRHLGHVQEWIGSDDMPDSVRFDHSVLPKRHRGSGEGSPIREHQEL